MWVDRRGIIQGPRGYKEGSQGPQGIIQGPQGCQEGSLGPHTVQTTNPPTHLPDLSLHRLACTLLLGGHDVGGRLLGQLGER